MKRKLCLFLALLTMVSCLTVGCGSGNEKHADRDEERYEEEDEHGSREEDGLTVSGGSPDTKETTESAKPEETKEPAQTEPALVDVEVLTQIVYYDEENRAYCNYTFERDELGRSVREIQTEWDSQSVNAYWEDQTITGDIAVRWNDDGSSFSEGYVYQDYYNEIYMKRINDTNGGWCRIVTSTYGDTLEKVETRAGLPWDNNVFSGELDIAQYKSGDWGTTGWKYDYDEDGNLICSIAWEMADGLMEAECKYTPDGDLLYRNQKENGVVTLTEEITYDEKGRIILDVYINAQGTVTTWECTYNDVANTGKEIGYKSDDSGSLDGRRKYRVNEVEYDSNGRLIALYGIEYADDGRTVTGTYNRYDEYDENGNRIEWRMIDNESGEVTVRSYDAHGNEILVENYDAAGNLVKSVRTDYIYTTIQVTPEVAEKYHSGK